MRSCSSAKPEQEGIVYLTRQTKNGAMENEQARDEGCEQNELRDGGKKETENEQSSEDREWKKRALEQ